MVINSSMEVSGIREIEHQGSSGIYIDYWVMNFKMSVSAVFILISFFFGDLFALL